MNIGLTLSGGGALGLAHIGAIKALEELKVPISHISGTSIGSIIGSIYSAHLDTDKVIQFFRDIDYKRFIRFRIPTLGLIDLNMLKPLLVKYLPNDDFRELKIPMYICVTNLNTGRYEIKSDGKLIDWIITSSSVPFIFKPQLIDGFYYSDGGIVSNLPVSAIRDLCDHIIAIDLRPRENIDKHNFKSYRNVLYRTIQISMYHNNRKEIKKCDLYVEMNGINQFSIFDFKNIEKLVEFGYHVMMSKKQELMNLLNSQDQSEESFNKV